MLAAETVTVARRRKDEVTAVDARPAILAMCAADCTVRALVEHVEPPIRPSELHQACAAPYEELTATPLEEPALVTRVAQGTPNGDGLVEAITGEPVAVTPPFREDELHRD